MTQKRGLHEASNKICQAKYSAAMQHIQRSGGVLVRIQEQRS